MIDPEKIREKSYELGFSACGFAKAEALPHSGLYKQWLDDSHHGEMKFMENNMDLRMDPTLLFPGAKTVISLMASYYNNSYEPSGPLRISRYAIGRDYHKVLKQRGQRLIDWISETIPEMHARIYVDSAPIMEKEWARRSGLGWIGKNSCLIRPGEGSWFFLGEILCDLDLTPDAPEERNLCGSCTRCIDACPTRAILKDGTINAGKCISYQTIELKGAVSDEFQGKTDNWLFGCDRCQEVCPHNRFAKETQILDFEPRPVFNDISPELMKEMDQDEFERRYSGTPLKRAGLNKLKQTSSFLYPDV